MERQSKEESLALWHLEKESMLPHLKDNVILNTLYNVLDKSFNDYSLTYDEYRTDIVDYFENQLNKSDDNQTQVLDMMTYLINKYNGNRSKKE